MLQVKLVKSPIGNTKRNRATVAALGLRKMHQMVVLPDNAAVRGMIFKVKHMLAVEEVEGDAASRKTSAPKRAKTGGTPFVEARKPKTVAKDRPDRSDPSDQMEKATTKVEKPKAEPNAATQSKPKAEAKPKAAAKPKTEAKPKAASKPAAKKEKK